MSQGTPGPRPFFGHHIDSRQIGPFSLSLDRYDRDMIIPWHTHGESYATVVVSGAYREDTDGGRRDCRQRNVVVHSPGERHADSFILGKALCLSVRGVSFDRSALLAKAGVAVAATRLVDEFRHPDALSPMAIEGLMLAFVVDATRQSKTSSIPRWLGEVRRVVTEHFQEPLTITELAQSVDIHPGHLSRAFHQHFGVTIGAMLRDLRVSYARDRLSSASPIQEIALDAGFADQSHLTRTFRRVTGMTPAAFRRSMRD